MLALVIQQPLALRGLYMFGDINLVEDLVFIHLNIKELRLNQYLLPICMIYWQEISKMQKMALLMQTF